MDPWLQKEEQRIREMQESVSKLEVNKKENQDGGPTSRRDAISEKDEEISLDYQTCALGTPKLIHPSEKWYKRYQKGYENKKINKNNTREGTNKRKEFIIFLQSKLYRRRGMHMQRTNLEPLNGKIIEENERIKQGEVSIHTNIFIAIKYNYLYMYI